MINRLRTGLPQPDLRLETDRALLDWRDHLLARCPVTPNSNIMITERLSLICGLRLWSLCEQNLPFWADLTIGQVLSEENVLGLRALVEIAGRSPRPLTLEQLVGGLADEIERAAGAGHSVAVRGCGGYLSQVDDGIPLGTAASLRGEFKTHKSLQLEFFAAATIKGPKMPRYPAFIERIP